MGFVNEIANLINSKSETRKSKKLFSDLKLSDKSEKNNCILKKFENQRIDVRKARRKGRSS